MGEGMSYYIEGAIYRTNRNGRKSFVTSPATQRALAILLATVEREKQLERSALKLRQDDKSLNLNERMLCSIFGKVK